MVRLPELVRSAPNWMILGCLSQRIAPAISILAAIGGNQTDRHSLKFGKRSAVPHGGKISIFVFAQNEIYSIV